MSEQNSIELVSIVFGAGESRLFALTGEYFEIIDAPNPIDVVLSDFNGAQRARMNQASASFYSKGVQYGVIQITSATAQTVRFAYGSGETGTRRATGSVTISGPVALDAPTLASMKVAQQGAFTQAQKTVTNTSASMLAVNANRRYLLIQNNDATGDIYVTLDGTAATTAKGVKIAAGGSYECQNYCPSGQIFAIGSIASNANCVAVEG